MNDDYDVVYLNVFEDIQVKNTLLFKKNVLEHCNVT